MWQAIYPDPWMVNETSPCGTWTIYPNTIVGETTTLTPFTTGDKTTPWTSKSARYTKVFGYSYPDVQDWLMTPAQLSANVTARVNQLYNPDGTLSKRSKLSVRIGKRETVKEWTISALSLILLLVKLSLLTFQLVRSW
jgi:tyrosinase